MEEGMQERMLQGSNEGMEEGMYERMCQGRNGGMEEADLLFLFFPAA